MVAGHSASQAEALAARCPGWQQAPSAAIDVFALANARLYDEIARIDPQPFKRRLAAVTHEWAYQRLGASSAGVSAKSVRWSSPEEFAVRGAGTRRRYGPQLLM